jgi:hypothetical protein
VSAADGAPKRLARAARKRPARAAVTRQALPNPRAAVARGGRGTGALRPPPEIR